MNPARISKFQSGLLAWYKKNARDLPWRRTQDPYKIWVSEIMLQQTQVDTVIPYYERWLKRFPTVAALAKAPLEEVLKFWAGLGYYRRARMLHEAAIKLVKENRGRLPETPEELIKIPGIGRYTAGAIASIAFAKKAPILDGNVIRILSRLTAFSEDIGNPKNLGKLWALAESVVPKNFPGDFNQAMMELGATVCSPQNPACLLCPVTGLCEGLKKGPENFPVNKRKEKIEKIKTAALVLRSGGKVLVQKQPKEGRWGGLWMFPHAASKEDLAKIFKLNLKNFKHREKIVHGFTKYQVHLDVYEASSRAHFSKMTSLHQLSKLAFPAPHQKIVNGLLNQNA